MFAPPGTDRRWRVIELLKWGEQYFLSRGFESPRREIEWLLTSLLSVSRLDLYLNFEKVVDPHPLKTLRSWVKRRSSHEPLQYITGETEFYGLPIRVDPRVLIPRPETERLVEIAIDTARRIDAKRIIDVGTGSGCIAIALAANLKSAEVVAIDNDEAVLEVGKKNAKLNGLEKRISFQKRDILSGKLGGTFDLLVSNPPYVSEKELEKVMPEVRDFEPLSALLDGEDGLKFYRLFSEKGRSWVRKGGYLLLEVGLDPHPKRVKSLFKDAGFENVTFLQDFNSDDRVASIEVPR